MKFDYRTFGEKPADGRSLFISMHGGGNAPKRVNEGQWKNQIKLYQLKEGIYLVPRAPTDTWNLWHESHIDKFFDRIIQDAVALEAVNPNKVYIMGFSAEGDGVYQLAPRMADRLAAASMMAGHPNETSPLGLRNIGFTIHVGEKDSGYNRNKIAREWESKLAKLREQDPEGYVHEVTIHKDKGHWMNLQDKVAIDWMAKFKRDTLPKKIVWKQDDVTHSQLYWLAVPQKEIKQRSLVVASRDGQKFIIEKVEDVKSLTIMLNDQMVNLDKPLVVEYQGKELFNGKVQRTIGDLGISITERPDEFLIFSARVDVELDK